MIPSARGEYFVATVSILFAAVQLIGLGGCGQGSGDGHRRALGDDFDLYIAGVESRCYLQRAGDTLDLDGILDAPIDSVGWSEHYVWVWRNLPDGQFASGWMIVDRRDGMTVGPFSPSEFMRRAREICGCPAPPVMSVHELLADPDRLLPRDS